MKGTIALVIAVTLAGGIAALGYQAAARQRDYRELIARGDTALVDDQTLAAVEAYSGAIALRSDSMLAHLRLAETYQRRGNLDEAAREFRVASNLVPTAARPLEELGDVTYQQQRYGRAIDAYARAFKFDDRSARVGYKLALAHYRDGSVDAALQTVRQSLALDSKSADATYLLGLCLRDKHNVAEAVRAFEQTLAIAPGSIPAREELADLYRLLDRKADEIEQLQALAALDRNRADRQVALGLAHHRAGHSDLAVLTLGSALERAPDDPSLYRALGQVWLDRARDDRALVKKAREALERIASNPTATSDTLTLYARARLQEGDLDAAERALQQAMTRFPVDPNAFALYATVAARQKRPEAARRAQAEYEALASK
ncbi:MAG TPA: tetratricopeptide repeat protein [Vicinamibacterales bacterium]|nr:tetratricopeptide repeat protein [Vicinamibacterales bacterium]